MQRLIVLILFSFFATHSYAQGGIYGFEAGAGYGTSYKAHVTPAFEGYCLKRFSASLYIGGALSFQRYSFLFATNHAPANYGDMVSIRQKCQYLFFSPKIDLGIGYRKYLHVYFMAGPGIYMGGNQTTNKKEPFWTTPSGGNFGADTVGYNTTNNIPNVTFRAGFGISERIPTYRYFNIILSQEFSLLPSHLSDANPALQTNYFSFTVGIMHKYPQAHVDQD